MKCNFNLLLLSLYTFPLLPAGHSSDSKRAQRRVLALRQACSSSQSLQTARILASSTPRLETDDAFVTTKSLLTTIAAALDKKKDLPTRSLDTRTKNKLIDMSYQALCFAQLAHKHFPEDDTLFEHTNNAIGNIRILDPTARSEELPHSASTPQRIEVWHIFRPHFLPPPPEKKIRRRRSSKRRTKKAKRKKKHDDKGKGKAKPEIPRLALERFKISKQAKSLPFLIGSHSLSAKDVPPATQEPEILLHPHEADQLIQHLETLQIHGSDKTKTFFPETAFKLINWASLLAQCPPPSHRSISPRIKSKKKRRKEFHQAHPKLCLQIAHLLSPTFQILIDAYVYSQDEVTKQSILAYIQKAHKMISELQEDGYSLLFSEPTQQAIEVCRTFITKEDASDFAETAKSDNLLRHTVSSPVSTKHIHVKLDSKTIHQYLDSAYQLFLYGKQLETEHLEKEHQAKSSIISASGDKKKRFHSLRSRAIKLRQIAASTSSPTIIKPPHSKTKRIIDTYLASLSLYISTYKSKQPLEQFYIKSRVAAILSTIQKLFYPHNIEDDNTLIDQAYIGIIEPAKQIIRQPFLRDKVLDLLKKEQDTIASHRLDPHRLYMHLVALLHLKHNCDPLQEAIIQTHLTITYNLIHTHRIRPQNAEQKNLLQKKKVNTKLLINHMPLLEHLQKQLKENKLLSQSSLIKDHPEFRKKLSEKHRETLQKLLFIHMHCKDPSIRYFLAKEITAFFDLIHASLAELADANWSQLCGIWHQQSDDIVTTLRTINQQLCIGSATELPTLLTIASTLVDLYTSYYMPPELYPKIIKPLDKAVGIIEAKSRKTALSNKDIQRLHMAYACLYNSEHYYAMHYYIRLANNSKKNKTLTQTKETYIKALRKRILAKNTAAISRRSIQTHSTDIQLFDCLSKLHEQEIAFTNDEFRLLFFLAQEIKATIPIAWELHFEAIKFKEYADRVLKKTAQSASSSSGK